MKSRLTNQTIALICAVLVYAPISKAEDEEPVKFESSGFGETPKAEDEVPVKLEHFVFPITEPADEVLRMFSRDFDLSLRAFLEEQGIEFPKGANCSLDSEKNRVEVRLEQYHAALVVWVLGDIMVFKNSVNPPTKEALVERYYRRPPASDDQLPE